ncbi:protein ECT2-like [Paramacrobiotus metropolitanus]|uniref:protein ECT2-like n=1 Tax=Paramacrobiotus metropolitanus TaxID=2943436 RepID=UPI002445ECA7|nr:protein ECT2-like [Paramacrobiotus metropolitanus]
MDIGKHAPAKLQFCLLDKELEHNTSVKQSVKLFHACSFLFCEEALRAASRKKNGRKIVFITENFDGDLFKRIKSVSKQILGPPALAHFAAICTDHLPDIRRPIYSLAMEGVVAVVSGFCDQQTGQIVREIHNMGGLVIRRLVSSSLSLNPPVKRPTHLITYNALSAGYQTAIENPSKIEIMTEDWPAQLWRRRSTRNTGSTPDVIQRRCRFQGCFLRHIRFHLLGFGQTERLHWITYIANAGGSVESDLSLSSDIVVVNHHNRNIEARLHVSSEERHVELIVDSVTRWFVLHDGQHVVTADLLIVSFSRKILPSLLQFSVFRDGNNFQGGVHVRKRRLSLEDAEPEPETFCSPKRRLYRSAKSMMPRYPPSDSPTKQLRSLILGSPALTDQPRIEQPVYRKSETSTDEPPKEREPSKRHQRIMELLDTERNYVIILRSLLTHVKSGLECGENGRGGCLDAGQVGAIFGRLPDIFSIHEQIVRELETVMSPWDDGCEIGSLFLQHVFNISKSYPPFVCSFEEIQRIVQDTCIGKAKVRTLLKRLLMLPEFGRQSLSDLLIRPVQRLPTVVLLLKDIQKYTSDNHPDHENLQTAINELQIILRAMNSHATGNNDNLENEAESSCDMKMSDGFNKRAMEKARKLASQTTLRVSKVFSGLGTRSGSGIKRAASMMLFTPAKSARSQPKCDEESKSEE